MAVVFKPHMANLILHKRSNVAGRRPLIADLVDGELALNTADGAIYTRLFNEDNASIAIFDVAKNWEKIEPSLHFVTPFLAKSRKQYFVVPAATARVLEKTAFIRDPLTGVAADYYLVWNLATIGVRVGPPQDYVAGDASDRYDMPQNSLIVRFYSPPTAGYTGGWRTKVLNYPYIFNGGSY